MKKTLILVCAIIWAWDVTSFAQVVRQNGSANTISALTVTGTIVANALTINTTDLVTDSVNHRVGIGTSSPCSTCTLHVAGNASVTGAVQASSITVQAGTGAGLARVGGTIFYQDYTQVNGSTTNVAGYAATFVSTFTIKGNTLAKPGDCLVFESWGSYVVGTDANAVVSWGGTLINNTPPITLGASHGNGYRILDRVCRTASGTASTISGVSVFGNTAESDTTSGAAYTWSSDYQGVVFLTGAAVGDISFQGVSIRYEPAP